MKKTGCRKRTLKAEQLNNYYKENLKISLNKIKNAVDPEITENEAESLEALYEVITIIEKTLKIGELYYE